MDFHPCPNGTGMLHYQKGLNSGKAPDISENSGLEEDYADAIVRFPA